MNKKIFYNLFLTLLISLAGASYSTMASVYDIAIIYYRNGKSKVLSQS